MINTDNTMVVEPAISRIREERGAAGPHDDASEGEVASLAYELWERRDAKSGSPVEDWLEAEQLLRKQRARAS